MGKLPGKLMNYFSEVISAGITLRRHVRFVAFAVMLLGSTSAKASDLVSTGFFGGAIGGYDTTAYFTQGQAIPGDSDVIFKWKGARWRFADVAAYDLSRADPVSYAPQFGGYCTNAMSMGKVVDGDPEIWRIWNGKLYLFYASAGREKFDVDPQAMINRASSHWQQVE